MTFRNGKSLGLAVVAFALLALSGVANATSITYTFDDTDVAAFGSAPYGTVTLETNLTGGVLFTVSLRSDLNFVNTGNHSVFAFNALGVTTTDVGAIQFNSVPNANFTAVAPGTNPPFGNGTFSLMINCTAAGCRNGAPGQSVDPLTFTVANASLSDFGFLATGTTAFFAADVICATTLAGGCTGTGATGAVGVTGPGTPGDDDADLPEPGTLALFGLGLLGLGFSRHRSAK